MSTSHNTERIDAPVGEVYALLLDASRYPEWLVGAQAITSVDDDWPGVGSSFHHRIGFGPVRVPGSTTIAELEPDRLLVLRAGMGPLGEAEVRFALEADGTGTVLQMDERPTRGPVRLTDRVTGPLLPLVLWGRNGASIAQIMDITEGR